MIDDLARAIAFLREAQRPELSVAQRLHAISSMAQALDAYCLNTARDDGASERLDTQQAAEANTPIVVLLQEAAQLVRHQLLPLLRRRHIVLPAVEQLGEQQRGWLFDYFRERIYPLLTPLAVDPGHPFPYISSDSLNLLVLLQRPGPLLARTLYARVKIPRQVVPRLIDVPPLAEVDSPVLNNDGDHRYWVWSEEVVRYFVDELFPGMSVTGIYQFRVLRAGGQTAELVRDKTAPVVRVDVQQNTPPAVMQWLVMRLDVPPAAVFRCTTPLGMVHWGDVAERIEQFP